MYSDSFDPHYPHQAIKNGPPLAKLSGSAHEIRVCQTYKQYIVVRRGAAICEVGFPKQ